MYVYIYTHIYFMFHVFHVCISCFFYLLEGSIKKLPDTPLKELAEKKWISGWNTSYQERLIVSPRKRLHDCGAGGRSIHRIFPFYILQTDRLLMPMYLELDSTSWYCVTLIYTFSILFFGRVREKLHTGFSPT